MNEKAMYNMFPWLKLQKILDYFSNESNGDIFPIRRESYTPPKPYEMSSGTKLLIMLMNDTAFGFIDLKAPF